MDDKIPPWLNKAESTEFSGEAFPNHNNYYRDHENPDEDFENDPEISRVIDNDQGFQGVADRSNWDFCHRYEIISEDNNRDTGNTI